MRSLVLVLVLVLVLGCSSYEATVKVQVAPAEGAPVTSGIYAASDPRMAALPRLPFKQATVDGRFVGGAARTWHVKVSYADGDRIQWRATSDDSRSPGVIVVTVGASGRKPVEGRFECPEGGLDLDLVGVLER
ncbi:MAG TPA: hypothetical protein VFF73_01095 [Planctomycetota bacterium]|nr:hypothetical protein [Planctomycetota bacterium]